MYNVDAIMITRLQPKLPLHYVCGSTNGNISPLSLELREEI